MVLDNLEDFYPRKDFRVRIKTTTSNSASSVMHMQDPDTSPERSIVAERAEGQHVGSNLFHRQCGMGPGLHQGPDCTYPRP